MSDLTDTLKRVDPEGSMREVRKYLSHTVIVGWGHCTAQQLNEFKRRADNAFLEPGERGGAYRGLYRRGLGEHMFRLADVVPFA